MQIFLMNNAERMKNIFILGHLADCYAIMGSLSCVRRDAKYGLIAYFFLG